VNDRVDPYVAVYFPPSPSQIGTVTHLHWRGLLSPGFLQSVIDSAMYATSCSHVLMILYLTIQPHSSSLSDDANLPTSFVSITANAFPTSPVTYIPPGAGAAGTEKEAPMRVPRSDAEHCWSLILVPRSSTEVDRETTEAKGEGFWLMAESVGKWDMRWG